jgi:Zn-finger nucleic acid-binding protein
MANKRRGYYTLKIGGKNRTMHFSFNFWANFTEHLQIPLEDIGNIFESGFNMKGFRALIYCGILTYDQEEGIEVDYTEMKVGTWLDDVPADEIEKIMAAMLETRILGNDLNMGIERNPQKKTANSKSKTKA